MHNGEVLLQKANESFMVIPTYALLMALNSHKQKLRDKYGFQPKKDKERWHGKNPLNTSTEKARRIPKDKTVVTKRLKLSYLKDLGQKNLVKLLLIAE